MASSEIEDKRQAWEQQQAGKDASGRAGASSGRGWGGGAGNGRKEVQNHATGCGHRGESACHNLRGLTGAPRGATLQGKERLITRIESAKALAEKLQRDAGN